MDAQEVGTIILFHALAESSKLPSDTLANTGVPEIGICNLLYSPTLRVPCDALFVVDREGMNQHRLRLPGSPRAGIWRVGWW